MDGQILFGQLDRGSDEYRNSQQNYQYVNQLTDLYAGVPYQENAHQAQGQVAMALDVFDGSENRGVDTFLAYQAAQDSVYFLNNGTTWTGQSQDAAATYINTSIHSGRLMAAGDPAADMFNVSGFTVGAINGLHAGGHDALIGQVIALSDDDLGAFILGQQGSLLEFGLAVASGSSFRTTLSQRLAAFGAERRSNFLSGGATDRIVPDEFLDQADLDRFANLRNDLGLTSNNQLRRNVAVGEGHVDGADIGEIIGVSGRRGPGVEMPENPVFATTTVGHPRDLDSEVFVLENLAQRLTPQSTGTIRLLSERTVCASCQGVITQFREMFPNIKLIVRSGKQ